MCFDISEVSLILKFLEDGVKIKILFLDVMSSNQVRPCFRDFHNVVIALVIFYN